MEERKIISGPIMALVLNPALHIRQQLTFLVFNYCVLNLLKIQVFFSKTILIARVHTQKKVIGIRILTMSLRRKPPNTTTRRAF